MAARNTFPTDNENSLLHSKHTLNCYFSWSRVGFIFGFDKPLTHPPFLWVFFFFFAEVLSTQPLPKQWGRLMAFVFFFFSILSSYRLQFEWDWGVWQLGSSEAKEGSLRGWAKSLCCLKLGRDGALRHGLFYASSRQCCHARQWFLRACWMWGWMGHGLGSGTALSLSVGRTAAGWVGEGGGNIYLSWHLVSLWLLPWMRAEEEVGLGRGQQREDDVKQSRPQYGQTSSNKKTKTFNS